MDNLQPDNQVILTCDALSGGARLPIAWLRQAGGRIFQTALGHDDEDWAGHQPQVQGPHPPRRALGAGPVVDQRHLGDRGAPHSRRAH